MKNSATAWLLSGPGMLLLQWTALFALAWAANSFLRGCHGKSRVLLWRSVLCFALALPAIQNLRLQPMRFSIASVASAEATPASMPPAPVSAPPNATDATTAGSAASASGEGMEAKAREVSSSSMKPSRGVIALIVWALGFVVFALRLLRFHVGLKALCDKARPAAAHIHAIARDVAADLAIGRAIRVVESTAARSPFVCGARAPLVVLPSFIVGGLSGQEITTLLRHELTHVRHGDVRWNLGWRWFQALFWFHPLVWFAPAAHSLACEQAADLSASSRARELTEYSETLARLALRVIEIPQIERRLTMNGSAEVVRRLEHLAMVKARNWTMRRAMAAYGGIALLLFAAGGWKLAQSRAAAVPESTKAATPAADERPLRVVILDDKGKPLAGATVEPYAFRVKGPKAVDHYGWDRKKRRKFETDQEGAVIIHYPVTAFPEEKLFTGVVSVIASHPDCVPVTADVSVDNPMAIRLSSGIRLRVVPYAGARKEAVQNVVVNLSGDPTARWRTNEDGSLESHQISPGPHLLQCMGRLSSGEIGYSDAMALTATNEGEFGAIEIGDAIENGSTRYVGGVTFRVELKPGIRVEGRLDSRVPRPVRNGRVVVSVRPPKFPAFTSADDMAAHQKKIGRVTFWTSHRAIEPDGSFVFESVPPGELDVVAHGDGFVSRSGGEASNRNGKIGFEVPQAFALTAAKVRIEVETEPTATLDVTVKTREGKPLPGATVYSAAHVIRMQTGILGSINKSSETGFRELPALPEYPTAYEAKTDANGKALMPNIPATASRLSLEHPAFQIPLTNKWSRDVRFKVTPGETRKVDVTVVPKGSDFIGELK